MKTNKLKSLQDSVVLKKNTCPICNSEKNLEVDVLGFLSFDSDDTCINIKECYNCGFIFYRHDKIDSLYHDDNSKYSKDSGSGANSKFDKKRLGKTFKYLANKINLDKEKTVLDIGCNNGYFLSLFSSYSNELYGVDLNINESKYSENLKLAETSDLNIFKKTYDLITINHVLEHVDNVNVFLNEVFANLNVEGYVYIEVPDAERYSEFEISPYSYFDLEHINHFRLNDLTNLIYKHDKNLIIIDINRSFFEMSNKYSYPSLGILIKKSEENSLKSFTAKNKEFKRLTFTFNENFIAYGVGANTLRSLKMFNIDLGKINLFIDNNSKYHGKEINGIKVVSPLEIINSLHTVVIFSELYFEEIKASLMEKGFKGEIINFWSELK